MHLTRFISFGVKSHHWILVFSTMVSLSMLSGWPCRLYAGWPCRLYAGFPSFTSLFFPFVFCLFLCPPPSKKCSTICGTIFGLQELQYWKIKYCSLWKLEVSWWFDLNFICISWKLIINPLLKLCACQPKMGFKCPLCRG